MDVSFIVAVSLFLLFVSLILVSAINYFILAPESATIIELRSKVKNLFDIFFGGGGLVTPERATVDLYRIPLLLDENNGTARTNEIVSLYIDFDDVCNKKISWNNTVRVYDQQFTELPSRISYQEFCTSQWLNRSIVTFVVNMSANEKKRVYVYSLNNSNTTAPSHNLTIKGYWTFDEAGGTLAKDFSGLQNNGTLTNFDFNSSSGWFNGTSCKYGSCLKFDGANDFVNVTSFPNPPTTAISVAAWVKIDQLKDFNRIVAHPRWSTNGYMSWLLFADTSNFIFGVAENTAQTTATKAATANQFHHVVGTYDGTTVAIYVNGVLGTTATKSGLSFNGTDWISISSNTDTFNGTIDDVRIYNRILTAAEIASIANATLPTVTTFPAENVTAVSASKLQDLSGRNYPEIKALLGGDFDFRVEIREKK